MDSLKLIRKSNKSSEHLIIFVHGFTGGSKTFVNNGKHFSDYFDSSILDICDIYEFRYYSGLIDFSIVKKLLSSIGVYPNFLGARYNIDLYKYSQLLETHYCNHRSKYKSINLISHSMGGLVAKHFIIETIKKQDHYNGFYISLSTPHRGVSEAKFLSMLNNTLVNSMEPFSHFIDETTRDWLKVLSKIRRKYYCATHDAIVNDRSACPLEDIKYLTRVEGTHTTIVKPNSRDCALIKNINSTIKHFLGLNDSYKVNYQGRISVDDILFYAYKTDFKDFYLYRNADNILNKLLINSNVWISGSSGTGKTNLIQFYLLNNKHTFISFDMSSNSPDISSHDILSYLYWSLRNQIELKYELPDNPNGTRPWIDYISELLNIISRDNQVFLFIDELHINSPDVFGCFIDDITTLISYHNNKGGSASNIKLIVSTINDPMTCDTLRFKSKFTALFASHCLTYWTESEISKLCDILYKSLELPITDEIKFAIIKASNGSPRRLKVILKKSINLRSIKKAITEVDQEGVY